MSTLAQVQDTNPGWQNGVNCIFRVQLHVVAMKTWQERSNTEGSWTVWA